MSRIPHAAPRRRTTLLVLALLTLCACWGVQRVLLGSPIPEWYGKALDQMNARNLPEAISDLNHQILVTPHYLPAYEQLADCYDVERQPDQAVAALARLQQLDPNHPHVATRVAEVYLPLGGAFLLRYARQAVIAEPASPRARMILACALAQDNAISHSLVEARLAAQMAHLDPDDQEKVNQAVEQAGNPALPPQKRLDLLRDQVFRLPY